MLTAITKAGSELPSHMTCGARCVCVEGVFLSTPIKALPWWCLIPSSRRHSLTSVQKTTKAPPGVVGHTGEGHRMTLEEGNGGTGGQQHWHENDVCIPDIHNVSLLSGCHHQQLNPDCCSCQWMLTGGRHVQAKLESNWELVLAQFGGPWKKLYPMQCSPSPIFITPNLFSQSNIVLGNKNPLFSLPIRYRFQQTPQFGWIKGYMQVTPSQNPHCKRENKLWAVSHTASWDAHPIILTEDIALWNYVTIRLAMWSQQNFTWFAAQAICGVQFHRGSMELSFVNPALFSFPQTVASSPVHRHVLEQCISAGDKQAGVGVHWQLTACCAAQMRRVVRGRQKGVK